MTGGGSSGDEHDNEDDEHDDDEEEGWDIGSSATVAAAASEIPAAAVAATTAAIKHSGGVGSGAPSGQLQQGGSRVAAERARRRFSSVGGETTEVGLSNAGEGLDTQRSAAGGQGGSDELLFFGVGSGGDRTGGSSGGSVDSGHSGQSGGSGVSSGGVGEGEGDNAGLRVARQSSLGERILSIMSQQKRQEEEEYQDEDDEPVSLTISALALEGLESRFDRGSIYQSTTSHLPRGRGVSVPFVRKRTGD